ncbi:hypothetical protein DL767_004822 [Monosporascus sp. MG133]|nr:hypothetical protein DL767_004822 [Monosporascus sp. MG133]
MAMMMRSPAFPPRRPSHLVRYIVPAFILLCLFYYLSGTSRADIPIKYDSTVGHKDPATSNHDSLNQQGPLRGHEEHTVKEGLVLEKKPEDHVNGAVERPVETLPGSDEKSDKAATGSSDGKEPGHHDDDLDKKPVEVLPGSDDKSKWNSNPGHAPPPANRRHPIDALIRTADDTFKAVLAKESKTLAEAADAYRKRRGRHPPPGFDKWYQFAVDNDAVMVEDFFDQIYHDLNPFWGIDPTRILKEACDYEMTINIRNHTAYAKSDWFWTQIWLNMTSTIEHLLPDMDIALNAMDEPRMVVPWETIDEYMQKEKETRKLIPAKDVIDDFQELRPAEEIQKDSLPVTLPKNWEDTSPYWDIARRGCPPGSPARKADLLETVDATPKFEPSWATPHQYDGYVSNYTLSTEFCHQPDLQGLEGIFIKPLSTSATKILFPMFGGSKLATNNEILLPAPMYWNEEERFTGGKDHGAPWDFKEDRVIWRGVATGGRNSETNWRGFQRHRFVSMANGTKLTRAEEQIEPPTNFQLPSTSYNIAAQKEGRLGKWVSQWTDVGFTDLMCREDYEPKPKDGHCPYTDGQFEVIPGESMAVQFGYKYLPDIDGNSFSGRYLGFLRSTSLPIKSTLWREWHDSRLVAWKHFVPMDNRFGDFYGIMEYFLGYEDSVPAHDEVAEKIATDGKAWAEKVLRKEDMQIYVLRLLLEYARISDERREKMGWVDDLLR